MFASPDGVHWHIIMPRTSMTGDTSNILWNPFRKKWVVSIKAIVTSNVTAAMGSTPPDQWAARARDLGTNRRTRSYVEVDSLELTGPCPLHKGVRTGGNSAGMPFCWHNIKINGPWDLSVDPYPWAWADLDDRQDAQATAHVQPRKQRRC